MNASATRLFLHELRRAARECPRLLAIVPLVTAFTMLVYHDVIPVRFDDRLGFLRNLLNFPWPIVAWITPYLILKNPDLQDTRAIWRTLPATKTQVFGSRILLTTVFTVVIPALLVAGSELIASSGHARSQFLLMAAYQWAYLWIGAFAAFARRGHRGVALLVGMAFVVCVSAIPRVQQLLHSQLNYRGEFNSGLLGMLPYWGLVAIGGPLVALWRIRRAGKPANYFVWIAVVAATLPTVIAIENRVVLHPVIRGERLPTVRAEITSCMPLTETSSVPSASMTLPGERTDYIAYAYAGTELTLPPEYAGARFGKGDRNATGSWENDRGRGRLDDFASNEAPQLSLSAGEVRHIRNGERRSPSDPMLAHLAKTLGLPSDPEIWSHSGPAWGTTDDPDISVNSGKSEKESDRWLRPSAELTQRVIDATFLLPNLTSSEYGFEALRKSPVRIRAELALTLDAAPKVICRVPMKEYRTFEGMRGVKLSVDSSQYGVEDAYGDRSSFSMTLTKPIDEGALANAFHRRPDPQYAGIVVNKRLGQVVILSGWGFEPDRMTVARESVFACGFKFSKEYAGDLPDAWWDEAEFVVLESEPGPEKILPLDIEIKPSVPPLAK